MIKNPDLEAALLLRIVALIQPSAAAILAAPHFGTNVSHGMDDGNLEANRKLVDQVVSTASPVSETDSGIGMLGVPFLGLEGDVAGIMYIEVQSPRRLKNRDLAILQSLRRQIEEQFELNPPQEKAEIDESNLEPANKSARSTLSMLCRVLKPEKAAVIVEVEGIRMTLATHNLPHENVLSQTAVSGPLIDEIWNQGHPLIIKDALNESVYQDLDGVTHFGIRSVCACPLKDSDGLQKGLVYLDRRETGTPFQVPDLSILGRLTRYLENDLAWLLDIEDSTDNGATPERESLKNLKSTNAFSEQSVSDTGEDDTGDPDDDLDLPSILVDESKLWKSETLHSAPQTELFKQIPVSAPPSVDLSVARKFTLPMTDFHMDEPDVEADEEHFKVIEIDTSESSDEAESALSSEAPPSELYEEDKNEKLVIEEAPHTEFEIDVDEDADPEAEAEADGETDSETDTELEVDEDADLEAEAEADGETDSETETELEVDQDADPEAEAEADEETDSETETELEVDQDADPEAEAEADEETDSETETELEVDQDADLEAEAEAESEARAESDMAPFETGRVHVDEGGIPFVDLEESRNDSRITGLEDEASPEDADQAEGLYGKSLSFSQPKMPIFESQDSLPEPPETSLPSDEESAELPEEQIEELEKSLAWNLSFQADDKPKTDEAPLFQEEESIPEIGPAPETELFIEESPPTIELEIPESEETEVPQSRIEPVPVEEESEVQEPVDGAPDLDSESEIPREATSEPEESENNEEPEEEVIDSGGHQPESFEAIPTGDAVSTQATEPECDTITVDAPSTLFLDVEDDLEFEEVEVEEQPEPTIEDSVPAVAEPAAVVAVTKPSPALAVAETAAEVKGPRKPDIVVKSSLWQKLMRSVFGSRENSQEPNWKNFSTLYISGKIQVDQGIDNEWPCVLEIDFPNQQMSVRLRIPAGESNYAYHACIDGSTPPEFSLTVNKPGFYPVKLSNVPLISKDGHLLAPVSEITLIPRIEDQ